VRLSAFQGGEPTAVSPDGRTLSTVTFGGRLALWDVSNPRKPARIATASSGDGNPIWGEAFSPDGRTLAAAYGDKVYLWDVASPARPRLLAGLAIPAQLVPPSELGLAEGTFTSQDIAFSADGRLLASVTGIGGITVWDVSDPARPARAAVLAGPRDFTQAIAFSPREDLLAGVTYHGTVVVHNLDDLARPVRVATIGGILARAFFPDGRLTAAGPFCAICSPASYAVAFAPDGRTLTVVVDRAENDPALDNAARDTVLTWTVTGSGALGALAAAARNVKDSQPALAPDGHTVVDGSPASGAVSLWDAG
jgi:WD40 repeat protein